LEFEWVCEGELVVPPDTRAVLSKTRSFWILRERLLIYHVIRTSRIRASPTSPPTEPAAIAVISGPDGEAEGVTEGDDDVDMVDIMVVVVAAVLLGNKVTESETPTECLVSDFTENERGKLWFLLIWAALIGSKLFPVCCFRR